MLIQEEVKEIYVWEEAKPITQSGIYWSADLGLISISNDGTNWTTIADKNLGATKVYNYGDELSEENCGKYYQWGNNYGFPFTGSITTSSTKVNASAYGPGNYYSSSTFITPSSGSTADWSSSKNNNLWGQVTGTYEAMRGPCSEGFRVASRSDMNNLAVLCKEMGALPGYGEDAKKVLKLPYSGSRARSSGNTESQGTSCYLWTSTASTSTTSYNAFFFSSNNVSVDASGSTLGRSYGYCIRPFKNEAVQPDESWTKLF